MLLTVWSSDANFDYWYNKTGSQIAGINFLGKKLLTVMPPQKHYFFVVVKKDKSSRNFNHTYTFMNFSYIYSSVILSWCWMIIIITICIITHEAALYIYIPFLMRLFVAKMGRGRPTDWLNCQSDGRPTRTSPSRIHGWYRRISMASRTALTG